MGIVRKQSIHSSIYTYVGFAFGAVNLWLLPKILTTEEFGLVRVLISVSTVFAGLCSLGTLQIVTRFFPYYQSELDRKKNDLLGWTLLISLLGFIVLTALTILFRGLIIRKFQGNSPLFVDYFYLIYPFTLTVMLFALYERFAWSKQLTVLTNFLREAGVRIFTLIIALLLLIHFLSFKSFATWYSLQFGIVFVFLYLVLRYRKDTRISLAISETTRRHYREMISYGGFIFGGTLFTLVEVYFNTILLGSRISLTAAGVFDVANFIATLLLAPKRSMQAAASATISIALKDDDFSKIENVYRKSSATLLIVGLLILGLIWLNIDHVFDLYNKPEYRSGKYVVLVIGIANLIDMATGLNYDILVNSKLWKLHFYISIGLIAFFLPVTYLFVRAYGMMGSAYGILLSLAIYNLARCLLIWWKFKTQPFNYKTLLITGAGIGAYYITSLVIPSVHPIVIDIFFKSAVFSVLFSIAVLGGKLSDDVSELYMMGLRKLKIIR